MSKPLTQFFVSNYSIMTTVKPSLLLGIPLLIFSSCSTNNDKTQSDTIPTDTQHAQLDSTGVQGAWTLNSYRVDCESTEFPSRTDYTLSFNRPDNSFGMTTDCNMIGGSFAVSNDTIRFSNIAVTEMACDNMTVEENMLRLFNDTTAYAICSGDTIIYTAPSTGSATFIKSDPATDASSQPNE